MNEASPIIEIKGLTYNYGRAEAVHDFDLTVQPGRCHGLFGRNGAGKTTTMKCLLNLLRSRSGTVRAFGLDPAHIEPSEPVGCISRSGSDPWENVWRGFSSNRERFGG